MKWPKSLTLIRHDESAYNRLKKTKEGDELYQRFRASFDISPLSTETKKLALLVKSKHSLGVGDHDTPLAEGAGDQTRTMAGKLKDLIDLPDIIFVSPYFRTKETLRLMTEGWPELKKVKVVEEERIREQDHGLTLLYNDWRVFAVLYPEQAELKKVQGEYWYRFPQGENVSDVRERLRSWLTTVSRDFATKNILVVTHHLAILALRANLERLDASEFLRVDNEDKPINAGVTIYRGDEKQGTDGKLILDKYNAKLY